MKIKYFLRGLGVGILVTVLLLFVGVTKAQKQTISDEEIMSRAKQLGMLTKEEANDYRLEQSLDQIKDNLGETASSVPATTTVPVESTEAPADVNDEETVKPSAAPSKKPKKKENNKQDKKKTVTLQIKSGMTTQAVSRFLYANQVIRNEEDFTTYMLDHKLTAKLQVGKYDIPVDATHAQIAEMITKK